MTPTIKQTTTRANTPRLMVLEDFGGTAQL
jgi:hypothetical protein